MTGADLVMRLNMRRMHQNSSVRGILRMSWQAGSTSAAWRIGCFLLKELHSLGARLPVCTVCCGRHCAVVVPFGVGRGREHAGIAEDAQQGMRFEKPPGFCCRHIYSPVVPVVPKS